MTNLYNGYVESESQTDARAWRIALQSQKYAPDLNTEAEANALANLIDVVNTSVPVDPWLSSRSFVRQPFNDHGESVPVGEQVAIVYGQSALPHRAETRPTYDQLINGAKFTDEHRAELHKWWNEKYK